LNERFAGYELVWTLKLLPFSQLAGMAQKHQNE